MTLNTSTTPAKTTETAWRTSTAPKADAARQATTPQILATMIGMSSQKIDAFGQDPAKARTTQGENQAKKRQTIAHDTRPRLTAAGFRRNYPSFTNENPLSVKPVTTPSSLASLGVKRRSSPAARPCVTRKTSGSSVGARRAGACSDI